MDPVAARSHAHASLLRARGNALPPEGLPSAEILDSWQRCLVAGQDWARPLAVPVVTAADLARRREASEYVRRLAKAEMETLAQQIAGSNHLLVFADRDGVVLDLMADNRFRMSGSDAGIVAGSRWGESVAGTNGLGTALAGGQAVAVSGLEHFYLSLGGITCTAAPVRDAAGAVVGVLDASSYFASRQQHTLALVQMAATHVENSLFTHQMRQTRGTLVLAIHPRAEYLHTLSAGLLAFDEDGCLAAANARARMLLQGLVAQPGATFEALFGEAFEPVLARARREGEIRLRDALGSSLVAQCRALPRALSAGAPAAGAAMGRPSPARDLQPRTRLPAPAHAAPFNDESGGGAADPAELLHGADHAAVAHQADPAVAAAYRLAEAALPLHMPILLQGETGSGKEWLARHLHRRSGRHGAFVAVNCAALPAELIEAELFGYVGGAFTGARREGHAGLIASADGGTLLLDEVGELPLALQSALLRFLDAPEVRPVGGTRARRVDVLLLAATHADLDRDVAEGRFRPDLLYRLDTVRVRLPPLRQRSDFAALVAQLLRALDATAVLEPAAQQALAEHAWPGNFRELRSALARAWLAARAARPGMAAGASSAEPEGVTRIGHAHVAAALPQRAFEATGAAMHAPGGPVSLLRQSAAEQVRREYARCGGSVSETARRLGISRTTVYRHLGPPGPARPRCR